MMRKETIIRGPSRALHSKYKKNTKRRLEQVTELRGVVNQLQRESSIQAFPNFHGDKDEQPSNRH